MIISGHTIGHTTNHYIEVCFVRCMYVLYHSFILAHHLFSLTLMITLDVLYDVTASNVTHHLGVFHLKKWSFWWNILSESSNAAVKMKRGHNYIANVPVCAYFHRGSLLCFETFLNNFCQWYADLYWFYCQRVETKERSRF